MEVLSKSTQNLYLNDKTLLKKITFLDTRLKSPIRSSYSKKVIYPETNFMFGAEVKFFAECSSSSDYVQVHSRKIYGLESGENLNSCAGFLNQSMGARNRERIGLSYWPAWLHRLTELIPWNRFLILNV